MKKLKCLIAAAGITGLLITAPVMTYNANKDVTYQQVTAQQLEKVTNITTLQQLEDIIAKNENVAVDIGATWCGPCKEYEPIFEGIAEEYKEKVVFCKITLDRLNNKEEKKISEKYSVRYIPKTIFFKDGKEVHNRIGGIEKEDLIELIDTYLLEKK